MIEKRKLVYICSPFQGDRINNIDNAEYYSQMCYKLGKIPICPHIYLERATGLDEITGDRDELLDLGKQLLIMCDEIWIFGNTISNGMNEEIKLANHLGIKKVKIPKLAVKRDEKKKEV